VNLTTSKQDLNTLIFFSSSSMSDIYSLASLDVISYATKVPKVVLA